MRVVRAKCGLKETDLLEGCIRRQQLRYRNTKAAGRASMQGFTQIIEVCIRRRKEERLRRVSRRDEHARFGPQRDLNPYFNSTTTSPVISASYDDVLQVRNGYDSNMQVKYH